MEPPPEEAPEAAPVPSAAEIAEAPPTPGAEEARPAPPLASSERPAEVLASVRSGPLKAAGKALTAGEVLREPTSLVVGASVAVLESAGAARFVLAPRTQLQIAKGSGGELLLTVVRGRAFATSLGEAHYALATRDGRAVPRGTAFVVAVEGNGTRVTTVEGTVSVAVEGATIASRTKDVRAGFELSFARGRSPTEARPAAAIARAVEWIPSSLRPRELPAPGLVVGFSFSEGLPSLRAGAEWSGMSIVRSGEQSGSSCVSAQKSPDTSVSVTAGLYDPGFSALDPEITLEARVKVDRRTRVVLLVWDERVKDNLGHETVVEPDVWTTVGAPLREFTPRTPGSKESVQSGDGAHGFTIYAGDGKPLELLVASVKLYRSR
jgi:hypothetical protein